MIYPIDAVIAVTYRCHLKCRMCSIWQIEDHHEIPTEVYKKLPTSLRDINISGGEPFIRNDLADIVKIIHERVPRSRIIVSTNGFFSEAYIPRALELRKIFPKIGFGFSIDGIGEMHDYMRGTAGVFEKVIPIIKDLKENRVDNIRIAYTLTTENSDHMIKVYELAKELGVQFTMQISHNSEFFFGMHDSNIIKSVRPHFESKKLREDFRKIIKGELASYNLKRWGKAFIYYGMYMLTMNGKRPFSTKPGVDYFYMDPKGNIYPSVVHNYIMGNLTERDFDTIWSSKHSEETRIKCKEDKSPHWMGCMLRKALLDHKFQIAFWALKNKFFWLKI